VTPSPRSLKTAASLAVLAALLALVTLIRCWNAPDIFISGKTFFVDADCYSRMTRVQRVLERPGIVIHLHDFENWPQGTQPHTTAPFDYLTAGFATTLRLFTRNTPAALDLAGAWVSPLLGLLTAVLLWCWSGSLGGKSRFAMLFLFAVSPILVHGTVLGRPDHQSLLILCLAAALGAETILLQRASRNWAILGGLAWGLGLWVSLYEPLILLAAAFLLSVAIRRKAFFARERLWEAVALFAVLLVAFCVDGWQVSVPEPVIRAYFLNWSRTIGELSNVPISGLCKWTGWLLLPAPLLLAWLGWKKRDPAAWFWLGMVVLLAALTCWQARCGYFLALAFVMALPTLLAAAPQRWIALTLFTASLWPILLEWDRQVSPENTAIRVEQRQDNLALYDVAQQLRGSRRLPILAPWWQSPALAYWSGQPCVAGSSHESLPGTVDASRFYLSTDPDEAEALLVRRRVACVVAYEPDRVLTVSTSILGEPERPNAMGRILYERPHSPPAFMELVYSNAAFRLYLRPNGVE